MGWYKVICNLQRRAGQERKGGLLVKQWLFLLRPGWRCIGMHKGLGILQFCTCRYIRESYASYASSHFSKPLGGRSATKHY